MTPNPGERSLFVFVESTQEKVGPQTDPAESETRRVEALLTSEGASPSVPTSGGP